MKRYFETRKRDDGTYYATLIEDSMSTNYRPDWLLAAVYEAHDDETPNDWRYATCQDIAALIDDGETDSYSIADSLTDIYTNDLLTWLCGHLGRPSYHDEAQAEGLVATDSSLTDRIRVAQFHCIEQMASILLAAAEENADES